MFYYRYLYLRRIYECTALTRTRVIYKTKECATSTTSDCNKLNYSILRVHFGFWKMLLEILLVGLNC